MVESWAAFAHSSLLKIFILLVCFLAHGCSAQKATDDKYYTNGWAIKVSEPGGHEKAKEIARKHGFEKISKVRLDCRFVVWEKCEGDNTSRCHHS